MEHSPSMNQAILGSPYLAGKLLSRQDERGYAIVGSEDPHPVPWISALDGLPIPPTEELRLGYGTGSDDYVASGQRDVHQMLTILEEWGAAPGAMRRVLEVGCAAGRMLRHVPCQQGVSEHWGVDISAMHIEWCQRHLMPPLFFAATTTAPHLPFADGYFDLVYAGSLFTHISDLADAWFLEILRLLRPGGHAYLTIHDERIIGWLLSDEAAHDPWMSSLSTMVRRFAAETGTIKRGYRSFSIAADVFNQVQVFYDSSFLVGKWGLWATFVSLTPHAYARQTALLFRKQPPSAHNVP